MSVVYKRVIDLLVMRFVLGISVVGWILDMGLVGVCLGILNDVFWEGREL